MLIGIGKRWGSGGGVGSNVAVYGYGGRGYVHLSLRAFHYLTTSHAYTQRPFFSAVYGLTLITPRTGATHTF